MADSNIICPFASSLVVDEARSMVRVSAFFSLQCFDNVGWAYGLKIPLALLELVAEEN